MKIVITGGGGFIGFKLAKALLARLRRRTHAGKRVRVRIDDQVHRALAVQHDFARSVPGYGDEAHALQHRPECLRLRRGVLDELDAVDAQGVVGFGIGFSGGHWRPFKAYVVQLVRLWMSSHARPGRGEVLQRDRTPNHKRSSRIGD